uniref:Uncharacterized protein n=1 Tax=Wuchereria bancrofti TaxID=6293 RepID=A0AAF5Q6J2_WUCBA
MSEIIVYLVFIIYCGNQAQNAGRMRAVAAADVITDYKTEKLWDNDLVMETMQVEELVKNCDAIEDGRLFILEEKSLLLMTNIVSLIKWN